jgi:beta-xylosidase
MGDCDVGVYLIKRSGNYYMSASEIIDGQYSCMVASSKSIYGPYSARYEAIPYAGHQVFFQDEAGGWWSAIFGDRDNAPVHQGPAIVPVKFTSARKLVLDGR